MFRNIPFFEYRPPSGPCYITVQRGADEERPSVHWAECVAVDSALDQPELPTWSTGERRRSTDRAPTPRHRRDASPGHQDGRRWTSPGRAAGGDWSRGRSPEGRPSGDGWRSRGGSRGRSPGGGRRVATPPPPPPPGGSPGRYFSAGGRESSSEDEQRQRRRPPQCYACRGFGHLTRDCPNVRRVGRW